jgi:RES domain-containing protein
VPLPLGWDADRTVAARPLEPWEGTVWRGHSPRYGATDHGGSLQVTGRWHRAADRYPPAAMGPALYTGLGLHVCLGEVLRNTADNRVRLLRYTELRLRLVAVLDCRVASALGLDEASLIEDQDFETSQVLAAAARRHRAEALLVPSASLLGDNLVNFPDRLRSESQVEEVRFVDPRLVKQRP